MEKLLLYCTKGKPFITYDSYDKKVWNTNLPELMLNGKIAVVCDCKQVYKYNEQHLFEGMDEIRESDLSMFSCLDIDELLAYKGNRTYIYGLELSNVKVLDKPKELSDFLKKCIYEHMSYCPSCKKGYIYSDENTDCCNTEWICLNKLTKAPQNMCYVYDNCGNRYILLPIKPEYLVKIIRREKTIEIRRVIVNALKELIR